jgi:hypothetical protein
MSDTTVIGQTIVADLFIAPTGAGDTIVISQGPEENQTTHVVVELKAIPYLIAALHTYTPAKRRRRK